MWFLLLLFVVARALTETPTLLFCVPHVLKEWDTAELSTTIRQCLVENYIHDANRALFLEDYVSSYQNAWQKKQLSEAQDNLLYHKKRELILFLRDTKLKAANHMHALTKCASVGHRMPNIITDAYTDEAEMMFRVMDIWTHHSRVDLEHCGLLLNNIVSKTHRHSMAHILALFHTYSNQLRSSTVMHTEAAAAYTSMLQERQAIINIL